MFAKILREVRSYVFPQYCLGCQQEGIVCCKRCVKTMIPETSYSYDTIPVLSCVPYKDGELVAKSIEAGKYHMMEQAFEHMRPLIYQVIEEEHSFFTTIDYICPVPLHKQRYAERGFNQANILAGTVSKYTDIPVQQALTRVRATQQQARLSREERLKNTKDAFVARGELEGFSVLLIDDVYTTGSTMLACAEACIQKGVREVRGFVIARG